ncbi:hypothetical protein FE782_01090 [Paenibacillus antri]|uniref:Uncharacterized protein n=1 Tax=Paenibacillus antri TaxID=2582848 RepID=A0A5R9GHM7_9BACL|nr:hypothetical protein [Paenibacillus antri]TLS53976.1 hypothetical protein FE782_01090 [Paenibacillus antri]
MDGENRSKRAKSEPNTSPPPAVEPKPKRKRKAASAGEGEAKPKGKAAAAKPSITQAETLGKKRGRKPRAAAAAELAAKQGGPLRSVRLSDAAFAGRLLGKYGWAIGAPKGRTAIVHRDGVTGAMRPASRSMHVDMHIRNVRPLLQLYTRVFATVHPPKPAASATRREGERSVGAAPAGRGGASAAKTAAAAPTPGTPRASAPAKAASGTSRSEAASGASTRSVTEVRRIWETFRETTTTLRRIEALQRTALSAPGRLTSVAARSLLEPSGDRRIVEAAPARDAVRGETGGEVRIVRGVVREVVEGVAAGNRSSLTGRQPVVSEESIGGATAVRESYVTRRASVPAALQRLVHAKAQGGAAMRVRVSPFAAKPAAPVPSRVSADASRKRGEAPRADAAAQAQGPAPIAAMRKADAGALPLQRAVLRKEALASANPGEATSSSRPNTSRRSDEEVAPTDVVPPIVTVTPAGVSPLRPVYRVERKGPKADGFSPRSFERSSLQEVVRHMTRLVSHSTASERTMTVVRRLIERAANRPDTSGPTSSSGDNRSGSPSRANDGAAASSGGGTQRQADRASARSANVAGERGHAPSMVPLRAGRLAATGVRARAAGTRSPEAVVAREAQRSAASASARAAAVAPLQRRIAAGKPLAAPVPVAAATLPSAVQPGRGSGPKPVALIARLMTLIERRCWTPATRKSDVGRAAEARASEHVPAVRSVGESSVRVAGTPAPVGMVQRRPIALVRGGMGATRAAFATPSSSPAQRQAPTRGALTVRKTAKVPPLASSRARPPSAGVAPANARTTTDVRRFADRITQRFQDRYMERLTVRFAERAAQVEGRSAPITVVGHASAAALDGGPRASAPPALQTVRATWSRREPERVAAEARRRIASTPMMASAPQAPTAGAGGPMAAARAVVERSRSASAATRSPMLHRSARRATLSGGGPFQAAASASRLSPMQHAAQTHRAVAVRATTSARQATTAPAAARANAPLAPAPQTHRAAAIRASAPARLAPSAPAAARASAPPAPAPQTHRAAAIREASSARLAPSAPAAARASAPSAPPPQTRRVGGAAPAQRAVAHRAALVHRASPPPSAARRGIATVRPGATIGHAVTESTVAPAQRHVRDIRLDVAAKNGGRDRPTQDPVVQTLQTAVKSVEAELQKAKELWAKPKLDMNRLSDQLYKELSKRIRFESQRRGL